MRRRALTLGQELALPVVLVVLWWFIPSNSAYFPPLRAVMARFSAIYLWGGFRSDVVYSVWHFVVGFAAGVAIGFGAGLAVGLSDRLRRNVAPLTEFARAAPIVALIPIALVMVGPGLVLEAGLIALGCLWPVMLNTADGIRGVDLQVVEMARSYGLSRTQVIRAVLIPAAMPQVFVGVRTSVGIGIAVMVIANMFGAGQGIGAQVVLAQDGFDITGSWAGILMIAIIGIVISTVYALVEGRLLRWHRGWRGLAGS
jgi:sulfonate transport system permease protein